MERLLNSKKRIDDAEAARQAANQTPKKQRQLTFASDLCVFCQTSTEEGLHNVNSLEYGTDHKEMAIKMGDTTMQIRFDKGDLIAAGAKYHHSCNRSFYNRFVSHQRSQVSEEEMQRRFNVERVKKELIESIKEDHADGETLFSFPELMRRYNRRRDELGLSQISRGTDLKEMILKAFDGEMEERGEGNENTF